MFSISECKSRKAKFVNFYDLVHIVAAHVNSVVLSPMQSGANCIAMAPTDNISTCNQLSCIIASYEPNSTGQFT